MNLFLLVVIILGLWLGDVSAATLYVSPTGTGGSNNCQNVSTPCSTSRIHSVWQSNDTIKLLPGTYNDSTGTSYILTNPPNGSNSSTRTIIQAAGGGNVILKAGPGDHVLYLTHRRNIEFRGSTPGVRDLKLYGADCVGTPGGATCQASGAIIGGGDYQNVRFRDVEIAYGNQGFQPGENGDFRNARNCFVLPLCMDNVEFINVDFHDIGRFSNGTVHCDVGSGFGKDGTHCHPTYTSGPIIVDGGMSHDNVGYGFECINPPPYAQPCGPSIFRRIKIFKNNGHGLLVQGGRGAQIHDVEFWDNGLAYVDGSGNPVGGNQIFNDSTDAKIYSNKIYTSNGLGVGICLQSRADVKDNLVINFGGGNAMVQNCNSGNSSGSTTSANVTSGTASSIFANARAGDFRLCVAKGNPTASCPGAAAGAIGKGNR